MLTTKPNLLIVWFLPVLPLHPSFNNYYCATVQSKVESHGKHNWKSYVLSGTNRTSDDDDDNV